MHELLFGEHPLFSENKFCVGLSKEEKRKNAIQTLKKLKTD